MLLLLAARSFLWTGFQLETLNPQPRKRLLLIFSPSMVYIVAYSKLSLTKEMHILQNPDAYKAAWKLLKVCIFTSNRLGIYSYKFHLLYFSSSFKLYFLSLLAF